MAGVSRASMREGPLADLFHSASDDSEGDRRGLPRPAGHEDPADRVRADEPPAGRREADSAPSTPVPSLHLSLRRAPRPPPSASSASSRRNRARRAVSSSLESSNTPRYGREEPEPRAAWKRHSPTSR